MSILSLSASYLGFLHHIGVLPDPDVESFRRDEEEAVSTVDGADTRLHQAELAVTATYTRQQQGCVLHQYIHLLLV